jgi:uncharacterized protein (TIGR02284 family)
MDNNELIPILHNLMHTCRKGQDGFRMAAESIQNSEFRRLFNILSQQRAQFIKELQSELHRVGGDEVKDIGIVVPFPTSSTKSADTRGDMRNVTTALAKCQRAEEAAINDYQEAMKADLPLDVQYVVKRQYMDIKDAFDRIRILQRAA